MEKEIRDALVAITEQLIALTEKTYEAEEKAHGVYAFVSRRHPNIREEYDIAVNASGIREAREEHVRQLRVLVERLKG
ncbi:MAG TPA: hypothetical protein VN577_19885 [Terriglobales bacterium]|nr:hypothetical protein [Terriglobales bacterium]